MRIHKRLTFMMLLLLTFTSFAESAKYNPFVWTTYKEFSHIYSIAMNMQEVYFGTDEGIVRFSRLQNRWDAPITKSNGFKGNKAELLATDKSFNKLWILTDQALSIYVPSISYWEMELPRTSLPLQTIHSIGFSRDSVYLAGRGGVYAALRGGFAWNPRSGALPATIDWYGEKANISLKDYPFLTPYYTTDGYFNKYEYTAAAVDNKDMWLGTYGYGVYHMNTFSWSGTHYLVGIANNRIEALFRDEDGFWIGGQAGHNKGFIHIDLSSGEGVRFRAEDIYAIQSNDILAITGDDLNVWFGTAEGLLRYQRDKDLWKAYSMMDGLPGNTVTALQLQGDTLYVGTNDGLALLSHAASILVNIDDFNHRVITAFGIFGGELLIGTDRGVFIKKGTSFEPITDPDGDLGFGVSAIFVDSTEIWFGTFRKGIDLYSADSLSWREFLPPTTIAGEYVYAIAGNRDFIWVGTELGVSRYHRASDSWQTFTEDDGLAHNEVYAIHIDDEFAWFGTKSGLTRFRYKDPSVPR